MNISMLALRLREKIGKFSGVISSGLGKVAERFVGDLVYGIQASQSVVLSEVGRVLEEVISPKKTEERLSRNLARDGLEDVIDGAAASPGNGIADYAFEDDRLGVFNLKRGGDLNQGRFEGRQLRSIGRAHHQPGYRFGKLGVGGQDLVIEGFLAAGLGVLHGYLHGYHRRGLFQDAADGTSPVLLQDTDIVYA